MNDELLMEIADCGSPETILKVIYQFHSDWKPPIQIEEFARSVGIVEFNELTVEGFVGALITNESKSKGSILSKSGDRGQRQRFTQAHELGHFLIPSHVGNQQCTAADLREHRNDTKHQRQEAEANRFAAGFLMPKSIFGREMERLGEPEIDHIINLAQKYNTSVEATANRFTELTEHACAFVFSKNGLVRYSRKSDNFPWLDVKKDDPLPIGCSTLRSLNAPLRKATSWSETDARVWCSADTVKRRQIIMEQSIPQKDSFQTTLLFAEVDLETNEDEEDDTDELWEPPRFR
ncbi:MAG: hypothetical protein Salg2KO_19390 [Salibacteraceae bacterium]